MGRLLSLAALLPLVLGVAGGCASTDDGMSTQDRPVERALPDGWNPAFYPLAEGDHWVYRHVVVMDGDDRETIRVKNAAPAPDGPLELRDPDGETYRFASDEDGWRLRSETDPADPEGAHRFDPPLVYANDELLREGRVAGEHRVLELDGEETGTTIRAEAEVVGWRRLEVPALGETDALLTTFRYVVPDGVDFRIRNWLVEGVGPVRRTFRMFGPDGAPRFRAHMTLLAARVGDRVLPDGPTLARHVFRHARRHRHQLGEDFPGLEATAVLRGPDGERTWPVRVAADGEVSLLEESGDAGADRWVRHMLGARFGHRTSPSFEEAYGDTEFELAATDGSTVGIRVLGDAMGSSYEVEGGVIRTVRRTDRAPFRIDVHEVAWKDRRYVPVRFDVTRLDDEGNVRMRHAYECAYRTIDDVRLPHRWTVEGPDGTRTLELRDIRWTGAPADEA